MTRICKKARNGTILLRKSFDGAGAAEISCGPAGSLRCHDVLHLEKSKRWIEPFQVLGFTEIILYAEQMKQVQTAEDVYPAIEELIVELRSSNSKLADILDYRIHKVAWTARSELFEELEQVLRTYLRDVKDMPEKIRTQAEQILKLISKHGS